MMKQIGLGLLVILLSGLWISCNNGTNGAGNAESANSNAATEQSVTTTDMPAAAPAAPSSFPTDGLRIAWVHMDSLLKGYDYCFAMQREMEALTAQAEKELAAKGEKLRRQDEKLRNDVDKGLVTRSEAQQQAQELAQEQTRYLQFQEAKRAQLAEEEQVRLRRVQDAIDTYIRKYNQERGFHYILSVGILYADPAFSITKDVLAGLNAEYASQQQAESKK